MTSKALVPIATGIGWGSTERVLDSVRRPGLHHAQGQLRLPAAQPRLQRRHHRRHQGPRGSYGETIGRPGWDDIQGGQTLNQLARIDGGTGDQGNPGAEAAASRRTSTSRSSGTTRAGSYMSAGYFRKYDRQLHRYHDDQATRRSTCRTRVRVAWVAEAVASGCASGDTTCIRNYIFTTHAGDPAVTVGPVDGNGNLTGIIRRSPRHRSGDELRHHRTGQPAVRDHRRLGVQVAAHVRRQRLRCFDQLHVGRLGTEVRQPAASASSSRWWA